jgi:replicative superfamily II helicase
MATLVWGVNLPAHTEIIKGIQVYNNDLGCFRDIGILDSHQMFGRIGRSQFYSEGNAFLIATSDKFSRYTSSLIASNSIESQYNKKFTDFLNTEISLGTVSSRRGYAIWAKYTFFLNFIDPALIDFLVDDAIKTLYEYLMI